MFGVGKGAGGKIAAVADIASASAGVAIFEAGAQPKILAIAREDLPPEDRTKDALRSGIAQALSTAGEKALAEFSKKNAGEKISLCYCVVGAPWTRSFAGAARSRFEKATPITGAMIAGLAKDALARQKDVDRASLLEANVVRVLLNGYPTGEPEGKKAEAIDLFTLASDCDAGVKSAAAETTAKLFPGAQVVWRSSARAVLAAAKKIETADTCLVVEVGMEATDLISVRKGVLENRVLIEQGIREFLSAFGKGKPAQETMSLVAMLEKDQCETEACEALRTSMAKAEPELVHLFGEALAKLSSPRKLPDDLFLVAPPELSPWLSRFFARIDFTQFTATARPFSVSAFSSAARADPEIFADSGLSIACDLVNSELSS